MLISGHVWSRVSTSVPFERIVWHMSQHLFVSSSFNGFAQCLATSQMEYSSLLTLVHTSPLSCLESRKAVRSYYPKMALMK